MLERLFWVSVVGDGIHFIRNYIESLHKKGSGYIFFLVIWNWQEVYLRHIGSIEVDLRL